MKGEGSPRCSCAREFEMTLRISLDPRQWLRKKDSIRRSVHLSRELPNTILWEDWQVDPRSIVLGQNGCLKLKGFENFELLTSTFQPLCHTTVAEFRERGERMAFRHHPRMKGVLCHLEPAA